MDPFDLVKLAPLMQRTSGRPEIRVGLIDGPVAMDHPDLDKRNVREVSAEISGACSRTDSIACTHGTFVAGILSAKRGSIAPAICPNCTLLVRPIFFDTSSRGSQMPHAKPEELATAVVETVSAGAQIINLSAALAQSSPRNEHALKEALDYAAQQNVLVTAAVGNQGTVGGSTITRHPWVIPVVGCDLLGRPARESNLGNSIGRRGIAAPSERIVSLGPASNSQISSGTSVATPFVTGTIALLWSEFPNATATLIKLAVTRTDKPRRTIAPPLLDAWSAYQTVSRSLGERA